MRTKPLSLALSVGAVVAITTWLAHAAAWPWPNTYLLVLNVWLLGLVAKDKLMATHAPGQGAYRTPESTLLLLAALGGTLALVVGMYGLRHKTAKQAFQAPLWGIALLQLVALYVYRDTVITLF